MRRYLPLLLLPLCLGWSRPAQAQEAVAVELCLAVDGSGSISETEFTFQRRAYAQAITDPRVVRAIQGTSTGAIALALMEWGGPDSLHPIVDWQRIDGADAAARFGVGLLRAPRQARGYNSISNAIDFCRRWMDGNAFLGARRVVDVSGDAGQRGGRTLALVREEAIAAGLTINALALNFRGGGLSGPMGEPLLDHFQRDVIGGPGAFALAVERQEEFVESLIRKLIAVIAEMPAAVVGDPG